MELIRSNITFYDLILESAKTYEETADAIVPDTFPDIARVAAVTGNAQIKDEAPQNDRVLVSGTVKATVLYIPEGETELKKLIIPLSFAHIEEGKGITTDSKAFVNCEVVGIDAKVMNSRKLALTAELVLHCKVYSRRELEMTSGTEDETTEILPLIHEASLPASVFSQEFSILEDIELGSDEEICGTRGNLRIEDVKLMPNKAILKGEADVSNLLMQPDGTLRTMSSTIPFTQIFDIEGPLDEDKGQVSVQFSMKSLDCEKRAGALMSVGITADAFIVVYETQELVTVEDAYHTTYPVTAETRQITICGEQPLKEIAFDGSELLSAGMRIASVIDSTATAESVKRDGDGKAILTAAVQVLYLSDDGQPYQLRRMVPLPFTLPVGKAEGGTFVLHTTAAPQGEDAVIVRFSVKGRCTDSDRIVLSDITKLDIDEDHPKTADKTVSLVLRFASENERLWDIAKSYNTTVDAIRKANKLPETQQVVTEQMLLIPIR